MRLSSVTELACHATTRSFMLITVQSLNNLIILLVYDFLCQTSWKSADGVFLTSGFADFERGNAISNCMTSISTIMSQFGSVDFDPHKVGLIPLTISN